MIRLEQISDAHIELGRALRRAREEAGLTQEQLADLASLSVRPIYLFESGKASIRLETFLKLLRVLGLDLLVAPRAARTSTRD